jgi:cytochrome c oxidase cbb3-type subunit 3
MAKQPEDRLLDHDYDGIREYDNPMPRWWLWIFYATIIFVPFYYVAPAPFGEGDGVVAAYEADVAAHKAAMPPEATTVAALTDDEYRARSRDAAVLAEGKAVYDANCAACHRPDGGGIIGPNLTDDSWIHGATPNAIHTTIVEGVLEKGMPPWGRILRPQQVDAVTAYVISLHGTNPPAPKAPEGTVSPPSGG